MNFNLSIKTDSVVTAKQIRELLVESAFMTAAHNVQNNIWTHENAAKALAPIVDTLTTGTRTKGHADQIKALVQENLDVALVAIASTDSDDSTDAAPDTTETDSAPDKPARTRKAAA